MSAVRRCRRAALPVLVLAVVTSLTTAAVAGHIATDKQSKPEDPHFTATRVAFDCSGLTPISLAPGDVDTLRGDTTDGENVTEGYGCRSWWEPGPEDVYEINVTERLELWAGLRDLDSGDDPIDLDLFLLGDCDTDSCLVGANIEFTAVLEPGTYYLVVDGFAYPDTQSGPYSLAYSCRWPGMAPEVCDPDYATKVTCGATAHTESGDLYGQANYIQSFSCSPFVTRGGEMWYEVTVPGYDRLTVTITDLNAALDVSLWIFTGCGGDAECQAFADDRTAGGTESAAWDNADHGGGTILVGVDCTGPPQASGDGAFVVEFFCADMVDNQKTSLGSLRALYR